MSEAVPARRHTSTADSYGLALALTVALVASSRLLFSVVHHNPGLFGLAAVIVASWRWGMLPATVSAVAGTYMLHLLYSQSPSLIPGQVDLVRFALFMFFAALVSLLERARRQSELAITERNSELERHTIGYKHELQSLSHALRREVEERRRAEQELSHKLTELKCASEELGQLSYVASHDLREPLRVIKTFVQLLERRGLVNHTGEGEYLITQVTGSVDRMEALLHGLLEYSRAGRDLRLQWVDTSDIVAEVLSLLAGHIGECGATVTTAQMPRVYADREGVVHVFKELLENALKFRCERPAIHISGGASDNEWRFSISDNGVGIDSAYHDKVFVIFQRLHGRDDYSGTGVGLAIAKTIVERHGGRIWVESRIGSGATFRFTLRRTQGATADMVANASAAALSQTSSPS